jgi:hypothetical protein
MKKDEEIIYVCEECDKIFTPEEKLKHDIEMQEEHQFGHPCKAKAYRKPMRCESYLQKFQAAYEAGVKKGEAR